MQDNNETEEIKQLKREIAKLRLEGNLRKSLSNQLTIQKKIADSLASIKQVIRAVDQSINSLENLKQSISQDLLSGRKRVNV